MGEGVFLPCDDNVSRRVRYLFTPPATIQGPCLLHKTETRQKEKRRKRREEKCAESETGKKNILHQQGKAV